MNNETTYEKFCKLQNRADVARLIGVLDKDLINIIGIQHVENFYHIFKIPKKRGGYRVVKAPNQELKVIQKRLNLILSEVYQQRSHDNVHGFLSGRSIVSNAKPHVGKRCIINIDLKDFFNSVTYYRVKMLLIKKYGLGEKAANTISSLVCVNRTLPQGAPTSPIITNLICHKLDRALSRYAKINNAIYTRYADDITFSTNDYSKYISVFNNGELCDELLKIIEKQGFQVNFDKVRSSCYFSHKEVTGITVNEKMNVNRIFVRNLRAMIHTNELNKKLGLPYDSNRSVLHGKIEFIKSVKGNHDRTYGLFANKFDALYNTSAFNFDSPSFFQDWLEHRVYIVNPETVVGFDYINGTGFMLKVRDEYFFVTAYHVIDEAIEKYKDVSLTNYIETHIFYSRSEFRVRKDNDLAFIRLDFVPKYFFEIEENIDKYLNWQTRVTIAGFPDYDYGAKKDRVQLLNSEITSGAIRYSYGIGCYNIKDNIRHGFSGGPVLNVNNKVIGFVYGGMALIDVNKGYRLPSGFVKIDADLFKK